MGVTADESWTVVGIEIGPSVFICDVNMCKRADTDEPAATPSRSLSQTPGLKETF